MGAVQESGKVVTMRDGRTKRFRSTQERRQIVEESLKPGASVSLVARAHDVNTNQVFKWRKQYREGRLDLETASNRLLPVKISESEVIASSPAAGARQQVKTKRSGIIDIDLGHARIRIEGTADPNCVRAVLEGLMR